MLPALHAGVFEHEAARVHRCAGAPLEGADTVRIIHSRMPVRTCMRSHCNAAWRVACACKPTPQQQPNRPRRAGSAAAATWQTSPPQNPSSATRQRRRPPVLARRRTQPPPAAAAAECLRSRRLPVAALGLWVARSLRGSRCRRRRRCRASGRRARCLSWWRCCSRRPLSFLTTSEATTGSAFAPVC